MTIMFKDGQILFNNGNIAMDPACCCGGCCGCNWLEAYSLAGGRIRVTFSGALGGYIIMSPITPNQGDCLDWFSDDVSNVSGDTCGLIVQSATMACRSADQTTSGIVFGIGTGSGTCDLLPIVTVSVTCGPPFSAVYTQVTNEIVPGGCALCSGGETVTMTLTSEDPWP